MMRVATWNLERGRQSTSTIKAQQHEVERLNADVFVITEAPTVWSVSRPGVVASPPQRIGKLGPESWVAIIGEGVEPIGPMPPYERLSVAAQTHIDGRHVVIYGSVLPWRAALTQAPQTGESSAAMFQRKLADQVADVRDFLRRFPDALVLWAGDFNQTLSGPNYGGSKAAWELIEDALDSLGMAAWNRAAAHANPGMCAIDLICGPKGRSRFAKVEVISPRPGGRHLSDHAAYVIEL